jgi:hypothetical protein
MSEKVDVWPDSLMIRDTRLHDDMGGLGQRIYTTAGAGYEKRKYIRADVRDAAFAELLDADKEYDAVLTAWDLLKAYDDGAKRRAALRLERATQRRAAAIEACTPGETT